MKKVYMKPALVMESYDLTQTIASGCSAFEMGYGEPGTQSSADVCGWFDKGSQMMLFDMAVDGTKCQFPGEGVEICYNGTIGAIMFDS